MNKEPLVGDELLRGLLADFLKRRPGLIGLQADLETAWLTLYYDPARFGFRQAEAAAQELAARLRPALEGCAAALQAGVCLDARAAFERRPDVSREVRITADPGVDLRGFPCVRYRLALPVDPDEGHDLEVAGEVQVALAATCLAALLASVVGARWGAFPAWADTALAAVAYLSGGVLSATGAIRALARYSLDIDSLMVLAALGAAAIGRWHEGAVLLFLFSLSNALEAVAMKRTRGAIQALVGLAPQEAVVRGPDGRESRVPIAQLKPGDLVAVRPGDRIPVDGAVHEGASEVDASMLSGESRWVPKGVGDPVFAGTLNQTGPLVILTNRLPTDTYLSRIIGMVEAAHATKARTHRLIDRFGKIYTPAVLVGAGLAFLAFWLGGGKTPAEAFYRSMVVLVVASPCALVLATPSAILSAIGHGAREGILFKGGVFVERLARVRPIAFDKTGILTTGVPRVLEVHAISGDPAGVLADAAALERHSTHPLALSIVAHAKAQGVVPADITGVVTHHGLGIQGIAPGGRRIWAGSEAFAGRHGGAIDDALRAELGRRAEAGQTIVMTGEGERITGLVALADEARAGAAATVKALRRLGCTPLVMVTGDQPAVARGLADHLALDEAQAGLLPDEKLRVIRQLGDRSGPVAMVGDGVNDGPALAAAHVGVTLGMASDVALEVADVVLVTNDLTRLPYAIRLARKATAVVTQNLVLAAGVIATGIPLALLGLVSLPTGVVMHEGSTLIVVANGLRMLRRLPKEPA